VTGIEPLKASRPGGCSTLGADVAIRGEVRRLAKRSPGANAGRPVDVILDSAGGAAFEVARAVLAPFGGAVTDAESAHGAAGRRRPISWQA
jgi:NADPH:quinone reductase-like Zn-dependent oxidoreductase